MREWIESIVIALAIAIVIQTFIVQAFKIPSGSMIPTFQIGDRIFVNKFLYSARVPFVNWRLPILDIKEPGRGDIIVFASPEDPKKDFVKRLIAFGGEKVEIKTGALSQWSIVASLIWGGKGGEGGEGLGPSKTTICV